MPKLKDSDGDIRPCFTFDEERRQVERLNRWHEQEKTGVKFRIKHLALREALDRLGFESITSGRRYKVWKRGDDGAAVYLTEEQFVDLTDLRPAQIETVLAEIRSAAGDPDARPETLSVTSILEKENIMSKRATITANTNASAKATTSAKTNGDSASKKAAAPQCEKVSKSGLRDEILARINAATVEKNPVIHSKFKNTTEKKIARDLFREGVVQRIEHEGQLYYLPKGVKPPKGAAVGEVRQTGGKRAAAPAEQPAPKTEAPQGNGKAANGDAQKGAKKGGGKKRAATKKVEGGEKALARNAEAAAPDASAQVSAAPSQAEHRRRSKTPAKGKATKKAGVKGKASKGKAR